MYHTQKYFSEMCKNNKIAASAASFSTASTAFLRFQLGLSAFHPRVWLWVDLLWGKINCRVSEYVQCKKPETFAGYRTHSSRPTGTSAATSSSHGGEGDQRVAVSVGIRSPGTAYVIIACDAIKINNLSTVTRWITKTHIHLKRRYLPSGVDGKDSQAVLDLRPPPPPPRGVISAVTVNRQTGEIDSWERGGRGLGRNEAKNSQDWRQPQWGAHVDFPRVSFAVKEDEWGAEEKNPVLKKLLRLPSSTISSSPKTKVQFVKVDASALIKEFSGLVRLVRELRFGRVETGETGESNRPLVFPHWNRFLGETDLWSVLPSPSSPRYRWHRWVCLTWGRASSRPSRSPATSCPGGWSEAGARLWKLRKKRINFVSQKLNFNHFCLNLNS